MTAALDPLIAAKRAMRRLMIERRAQFAAQADPAAAARTAAAAFPFDPRRPPHVVSAYHRMGAEIDPQPLVDRLAAAGCRICLPAVVQKGAPLVFREAVPLQDLVPDGANILGPPPSSPTVVPDLVLAPLLAFDAQGWRLGYGGGFYDRTLAALRARGPVFAVGLAFAMQEVETVPRRPGDERLDAILTESGYRTIQHKDV